MTPYERQSSPLPRELRSYGVSRNGFLPEDDPLSRLPNEYYAPWEAIMEQFPELVRSGEIRERIRQLPILNTMHLGSESEWQRAYSILAFMAQGYIWSGEAPSEVRLSPLSSGNRLLQSGANVLSASSTSNHCTIPSSILPFETPAYCIVRSVEPLELEEAIRRCRYHEA